ncbi:MAG: Sua5/YciO/YrdC/YwlC family protein [Patescibacteria group bacterium]
MLNKYIKWVKKGNILLIPFDTVWGLATDATNQKAVRTIFNIKQRSLEKPISVLMPDSKHQVGEFTYLVSYHSQPQLSPLCFTHQNDFTVGERSIKSKYLVQKICSVLGKPLTATSANVSGEHEINNLAQAKQFYHQLPKKFQKNVMLVNTKFKLSRKPSQIIDLTGDQPKKIER